MKDRIKIGAISGAFGVKGEVRIKSYCADPFAIADYTPLYGENGQVFTTLVITGQTRDALICRMDGIATKEQAEAAKGVDLLADRAVLPSLPDDEFYYTDLIGLQVFSVGGSPLGHIKTVQNHGAGDLLELSASGWKETVFIPFTKDTVPTIDLTARRVVIDPPTGLLPDE